MTLETAADRVAGHNKTRPSTAKSWKPAEEEASPPRIAVAQNNRSRSAETATQTGHNRRTYRRLGERFPRPSLSLRVMLSPNVGQGRISDLSGSSNLRAVTVGRRPPCLSI
jgi:hypothetical protein